MHWQPTWTVAKSTGIVKRYVRALGSYIARILTWIMDFPTQAETQQFWQHGLWQISLMVCGRQSIEVAAVIDNYLLV